MYSPEFRQNDSGSDRDVETFDNFGSLFVCSGVPGGTVSWIGGDTDGVGDELSHSLRNAVTLIAHDDNCVVYRFAVRTVYRFAV